MSCRYSFFMHYSLLIRSFFANFATIYKIVGENNMKLLFMLQRTILLSSITNIHFILYQLVQTFF